MAVNSVGSYDVVSSNQFGLATAAASTAADPLIVGGSERRPDDFTIVPCDDVEVRKRGM